jgi:RimJ/RimL family protein N-acetyltransferase
MSEMPFVAGETCYLRGIQPEDIPTITAWFNDPYNTRYTETGRTPLRPERFVERYAGPQPASTVRFAICQRDPQQLIGNISLVEIHPVHRRAAIGIMIGERSAQGKGYGTAAMHLICEYAFRRLNLHSLWLDVVAANVGGVKAYQKVGFQVDCIERESVWAEGQFHDMLRMSLLARDYITQWDTPS